MVYSITGHVYTMGQKFKGLYLWFTVLQDRFTLWDNVKRCIFVVYSITGQVYTMSMVVRIVQ